MKNLKLVSLTLLIGFLLFSFPDPSNAQKKPMPNSNERVYIPPIANKATSSRVVYIPEALQLKARANKCNRTRGIRPDLSAIIDIREQIEQEQPKEPFVDSVHLVEGMAAFIDSVSGLVTTSSPNQNFHKCESSIYSDMHGDWIRGTEVISITQQGTQQESILLNAYTPEEVEYNLEILELDQGTLRAIHTNGTSQFSIRYKQLEDILIISKPEEPIQIFGKWMETEALLLETIKGKWVVDGTPFYFIFDGYDFSFPGYSEYTMTLFDLREKMFSTENGIYITYLPLEDTLWIFEKGENEGDEDKYHFLLTRE